MSNFFLIVKTLGLALLISYASQVHADAADKGGPKYTSLNARLVQMSNAQVCPDSPNEDLYLQGNIWVDSSGFTFQYARIDKFVSGGVTTCRLIIRYYPDPSDFCEGQHVLYKTGADEVGVYTSGEKLALVTGNSKIKDSEETKKPSEKEADQVKRTNYNLAVYFDAGKKDAATFCEDIKLTSTDGTRFVFECGEDHLGKDKFTDKEAERRHVFAAVVERDKKKPLWRLLVLSGKGERITTISGTAPATGQAEKAPLGLFACDRRPFTAWIREE